LHVFTGVIGQRHRQCGQGKRKRYLVIAYTAIKLTKKLVPYLWTSAAGVTDRFSASG
jgi:hypothetical protein